MSLTIIWITVRSTPSKAEQPLRGTELPEKEVQKDQNIQKICLEETLR